MLEQGVAGCKHKWPPTFTGEGTEVKIDAEERLLNGV